MENKTTEKNLLYGELRKRDTNNIWKAKLPRNQ